MTPDKYTIKEFFMPVGDGHKLYVHDWGNKNAKTPIIFLHGGPGSHTKDGHKQLFDPNYQRVIFHDQRGAGQSTPQDSIKNNTTDELVEDINKIANKLKIDKFVLTGGSWGSCLALVYAIKYPERVDALVLRGIYTGSKAETNWVDNGGFRDFMPDVWDIYLDNTPKKHHSDPTAYHYKRILGNNPKAMKESAYVYGNMEAAALQLDDRYTPDDYEGFEPAGARIQAHYLSQGCFLPDRFVLNNAHKLNMPVRIVQGRYDMVCPPKTAYELHNKLKNSWLTWTVSGHRDEREAWSILRTELLHLSGIS